MFRLLSVLAISISLENVKSEECTSLVDTVFLVDTSDSFGPVNFKTSKVLMETFVSGFTVGKHYAQIGVDTFDDTFKSEFQLKTYNKKSSIISAIRRVKYRGRGTDMVKALKKVRKISFSSRAGSRKDATKVVIMITDGWSYNNKATKDAASELKKHGVFLFIIGVGRRVEPKFYSIASDPKNEFSFKAKTRTKAMQLAKGLIKYSCKGFQKLFIKGYVGCFKKQKTYKYTKSSNRITPQICINMCKLNGFKYANIGVANVCHCGKTIQKDLRQKNDKCKLSCHGNQNIILGGTDTVAVYKTGYLGCFTDHKDRVLPYHLFQDYKMTPEFCIAFCKDKSFPYAGLQRFHHCLCGDDYSKGKERPESECQDACDGDTNRKCGGSMRNNVFETGSNYVGCFKERKNGIFNKISLSHSSVTNTMCISWCREQGYKFAGTKKGNWCGCGYEFNEYNETKEKRSQCNRNCRGNGNQKCGGSASVTVFKTGLHF